MRKSLAAALLIATAANAAYAQSGDESTRQVSGVLGLEANATKEVEQDTVHITMSAQEQGPDAATVSRNLTQKANKAMSVAKSQSAVDVHTGNVSLYPTTNRDGKITAWRGRTELQMTSKDFGAASRLASQISDQMQMDGVSFSLSREAQEQTQAELTNQAIQAFRNQAQNNVKAFGYSGYTIRQVQVGANAPVMPRAYAMKAMAMSASADAAPPMQLEGGKTQVTVTVSGTVQMK
ncbi:periplasmic or secreted protein [Pandoraea aquatica]|uniref:Periplasmic or secreted protein n=1 Tax=Pandoraea aquatica TaxID=2508290 RepID=A0A5E4Y606_9BURK|nr:SIMPL domain-containing protein [Pandoraea aquatica]VVE43994.1 periplasmic or secreted protein [Pandoraea aquatica]